MRLLRLFLTAWLLALPQAGNATTIATGEDLQRACDAAATFPECVEYLELVYQTAKAIARLNGPGGPPPVGSCGPGQGIDTVPLVIALRTAWQAYAGRHPDRLRRPAVGSALLAFEQQWPCQR